MEEMGLNSSIDKLQRIAVLTAGKIFGQHSYLLEKQRTGTIIASSDIVHLIRFDGDIFQQTSALILAKNLLMEHKALCHKAFPRLRDDQLTKIAALSEVFELKPGTMISKESQLGGYLYIVKSGTIARYRVVDFTELSFRKIAAPFEHLELHFPDGLHPVHIDDFTTGAVFADPALKKLADPKFKVKTTSNVELLALDFDYFKIVAGAKETEEIRQELRCDLTEQQVIRIWVDAEKQRLWNKFKVRETKESHKALKGYKEFVEQRVGMRRPKIPKSLKPYKPKKVVPYASKSLRG